MSFCIGNTEFRIRFSLALFLCLIPLLPGRLLPLLVAAVILHEIGHLCCLWRFHMPIRRVDFSLCGIKMIPKNIDKMCLGKTIILNLAGPLANALSAGFAALLWQGIPGARFAAVSLTVGIVNLIPFGTTDGASILEAALAAYFAPAMTAKYLRAVRLCCVFIILSVTILQWVKTGWHWYYLLGIGYLGLALVEEPA